MYASIRRYDKIMVSATMRCQEELNAQRIRQQTAEIAMTERIKSMTHEHERLFEANHRLKDKMRSSSHEER